MELFKKILAVIIAALVFLFLGKILGFAVIVVFKLAVAIVIIAVILLIAAWLYDKFLK